MLVRYGRCVVADKEDEEASAEELDYGEVEVVDSTYYSGAGRGKHTAPRAVGKLGPHSSQAHGQAPHQAPESTLIQRHTNTYTH